MLSEDRLDEIHDLVLSWQQDERRKQECPTSDPIVNSLWAKSQPLEFARAAKEMGISENDLAQFIMMIEA